MLIIKEEISIFNSIMTSYHVFDNKEKFEDYKEQMNVIDFGTPRKRLYWEIDKSIINQMSLDALKDTTIGNFIKIIEIVKSI